MSDDNIHAHHLRIIAARLDVQPHSAVGAVDNLREDYDRALCVLAQLIEELGMEVVDVGDFVSSESGAIDLMHRFRRQARCLRAVTGDEQEGGSR